MTLLSISLINH